MTAVWRKSDRLLVVSCFDSHSLLQTSMTRSGALPNTMYVFEFCWPGCGTSSCPKSLASSNKMNPSELSCLAPPTFVVKVALLGSYICVLCKTPNSGQIAHVIVMCGIIWSLTTVEISESALFSSNCFISNSVISGWFSVALSRGLMASWLWFCRLALPFDSVVDWSVLHILEATFCLTLYNTTIWQHKRPLWWVLVKRI